MKVLWFECCRLSFLFGIIEGNVTPFSGADADSVFNGDDEDAAVADFAGLCGFDDSLYCFSAFLSRTTIEMRIRSMELVSYSTPR